MKIGVYPGTFDPITNGHIDIIRRSLQVFDKVIVAVAPNPKKKPIFDIHERVEMIREATRDIPNVEIEIFEGLLAEYMKRKNAHAIIRGLRAVSDFEHEFMMALMNRKLDSEAETVFLMPSEEYSYLTSSAIKEVASYGGVVKDLVPPIVARRLRDHFQKKQK
ncbi:MAG TPA: pantetheine-phosphate adenylyltransferase [Nitrospiria bacterium]|jgi:pantetheine-phosphate adenylyltransferase|nr:pantetheine-phosphate adenylyltransferase [Nitrospiria bacterium]